MLLQRRAHDAGEVHGLYARDYVALRYPDQEVVSVLHLEECRGDGSRRFACHLGVNRSDLATGLRLDEGPARRAAAARAATVRALDERYGLRQLERGRANSRAHARQPSRAEREMARDRRTGVVVRFTARGIREGLEAFRALERVAERQYEQEDGRS